VGNHPDFSLAWLSVCALLLAHDRLLSVESSAAEFERASAQVIELPVRSGAENGHSHPH
jgi:hypothetical protein